MNTTNDSTSENAGINHGTRQLDEDTANLLEFIRCKLFQAQATADFVGGTVDELTDVDLSDDALPLRPDGNLPPRWPDAARIVDATRAAVSHFQNAAESLGEAVRAIGRMLGDEGDNDEGSTPRD